MGGGGRFRARWTEIVAQGINPALVRFRDFLRDLLDGLVVINLCASGAPSGGRENGRSAEEYGTHYRLRKTFSASR